MSEIIPNKKEIVGLVEAQAKSIDSISEDLVKVENLIKNQDSKNLNIIVGVLIAFILIVATVAVEVILSNKENAKFYSNLEQFNATLQKDIYEQNLKVQELSNKLDNIKIRNPYLK